MAERAFEPQTKAVTSPNNLKDGSLDILQRYNLTDKQLTQSRTDQSNQELTPAAKLSQECGSLLKRYQFEKEFLDSGGRHFKNPYPELDRKYIDFGCKFEKPKPH